MSDLQKQLDQVKLDAERITRERAKLQAESKEWQESKDRPVTLDETPEPVVAEPEVKKPKAKAVKKKG